MSSVSMFTDVYLHFPSLYLPTSSLYLCLHMLYTCSLQEYDNTCKTLMNNHGTYLFIDISSSFAELLYLTLSLWFPLLFTTYACIDLCRHRIWTLRTQSIRDHIVSRCLLAPWARLLILYKLKSAQWPTQTFGIVPLIRSVGGSRSALRDYLLLSAGWPPRWARTSLRRVSANWSALIKSAFFDTGRAPFIGKAQLRTSDLSLSILITLSLIWISSHSNFFFQYICEKAIKSGMYGNPMFSDLYLKKHICTQVQLLINEIDMKQVCMYIDWFSASALSMSGQFLIRFKVRFIDYLQ